MSRGVLPDPRVPGTVASRLAPALRTALAAAPRLPEVGADARPAAVLMLLGEVRSDGGAGLGVLLTRRSDTLRSHAGQVALPGGRREPADAEAAATALREAGEEVGLDPAAVAVVAVLPPLGVVPSNHLVTPVLAWWPEPRPLAPDGVEVAAAALVPLADLAAARVAVRHPWGATPWPGYDVPGYFVWGFTGWLVTALLSAAGHDVSLDGAREVAAPLPPAATAPAP